MRTQPLMWAGILLFLPAMSGAQADAQQPATQGQSDLLAGHSLHGEAFNEGPRQKAYLMGGTGKVNFSITAKSAEAEEFFNQGVGQLHGFWYFEAERSFRQVAALDPDCAMAYWGMALANVNNPKRAKSFMEKATGKKGYASRRETLWIDAYANFFKDDPKDDKSRRSELVRKLEDIIHEFPEDVEAKAFLAFHIWNNDGHGWAIPSQVAVESLIKEVLAEEPMHPVNHYLIHLWDGDRATNALKSASRCGQSAPSIAHMWHMSGHTFTKLQRYSDAAWQQEASARVDHAHMMRDRVLPDQIHNYAHNNQWLVENLEFVGRVHDAIDLAKNLIELPRHPRWNTLNRKEDGTCYDRNNGSSSEGRRRLFETLTCYEMWDELIALSETMYLEPTDLPAEKIKRLRLLGVAHFSKKERPKGEQQIAALEAMRQQLRDDRQAAAEQAESRARKENQADDKVAKAMADAMQSFGGQMLLIDTALAELQGLLAIVRGEKDKAQERFEQAKDIPKERLARVWLDAGDKEKAEQLARDGGGAHSKHVYLLANYVEILQRCGKENEAEEAFRKLRELSADADLDVPVMRRLQPVAQSLNLPADWRARATVGTDVGDRPDLKSLGPFRWQPSPAPDWSLPDANGKTVSLTEYRGKAVVVIFYLGAGCPHCMEQLNVFKPMTDEFAASGISLVAISTDSAEGLQRTFEKANLENAFPLLSDQELKAFKAYRAFDDFENTPLHGTFLIDGHGLIRWQDISYEPFREVKFLLGEAKRLLSLPIAGREPTAISAK